MSVLQNINGSLYRMDASDLAQLAAVDTEGILGGTPGATTDGQTLVDQLAADDVQAQTDIGQIKTDLSDLEDDMSEYHVVPSRNKVPNNKATKTVNNVTFTVNENLSVTINTGSGGASADAYFIIVDANEDVPLAQGDYVISGCTGGSDSTFRLYLQERNADNTGWGTAYPCYDGAVNYTRSNSYRYVWAILVKSGATVTNKTIYPMISTAADYAANPTYEPHWVCMRDGKLDVADNLMLGSWNGLKVTATTQTVSGATFTVNSDGSIKVNTPDKYTGGLNALLIATITDDTGLVGRYLTGCPAGGAFNSYRLFYRVSVGGGTMINDKSGYDIGNGFKIPAKLGAGEIAQIYIQIPENLTVSNKTFYPAIVPKMGFPFVPYAMTNRELTERLTEHTDEPILIAAAAANQTLAAQMEYLLPKYNALTSAQKARTFLAYNTYTGGRYDNFGVNSCVFSAITQGSDATVYFDSYRLDTKKCIRVAISTSGAVSRSDRSNESNSYGLQLYYV